MEQILLIIHVLVSVSLIGLILVQQGKGAAVGAAFGSGASGTVFGSHGSGAFLFKLTSGLASLFFITSLSLGYLAFSGDKQQTDRLQFQLPVSVQQQTQANTPSVNKTTTQDQIPVRKTMKKPVAEKRKQ